MHTALSLLQLLTLRPCRGRSIGVGVAKYKSAALAAAAFRRYYARRPSHRIAPLLGARGARAELRGRAGAGARGGPGPTARPQLPGARPPPPSARRPGTQLTASSQDCHCSGATWQVTACGAPRQAALGAPAAADAGASLHAGAGEQLAAKAACAARRLRGRGWEDA